MVCEPDLITTGEAMYMKYNVINSGWYTIGRDYLKFKWDWGVILYFRCSTFLSASHKTQGGQSQVLLDSGLVLIQHGGNNDGMLEVC